MKVGRSHMEWNDLPFELKLVPSQCLNDGAKPIIIMSNDLKLPCCYDFNQPAPSLILRIS